MRRWSNSRFIRRVISSGERNQELYNPPDVDHRYLLLVKKCEEVKPSFQTETGRTSAGYCLASSRIENSNPVLKRSLILHPFQAYDLHFSSV